MTYFGSKFSIVLEGLTLQKDRVHKFRNEVLDIGDEAQGLVLELGLRS